MIDSALSAVFTDARFASAIVNLPVSESVVIPAAALSLASISVIVTFPAAVSTVYRETVVDLLPAANATVVILNTNVAANKNPANFFIGLPPKSI